MGLVCLGHNPMPMRRIGHMIIEGKGLRAWPLKLSSVNDVRKERVIREELENLLHREELMWVQKARSDWIIMGDRNTKYFQTVVKQRRARSRIIHLNRIRWRLKTFW